jgi:DnaJ-domain-containing protein 1
MGSGTATRHLDPAGRHTPEARELSAKQQRLADLRDAIAEKELDLATCRASLASFEQRYRREVCIYFAEMDAIEVLIAEVDARSHPADPQYAKRVEESRARAADSAGYCAHNEMATDRFRPSESLKRMFREVAKAVHPDLATDEKERQRRAALMTEANAAYTEGDEARLRAILDEWASDPSAVTGDGVGAELVRTIRRIAQLEARIAKLDEQIQEVRDSELYRLMVEAQSGEASGVDLIAGLAHRARNQVAAARERLRRCSNERSAL